MQKFEPNIDPKQVLRYLGHTGQELTLNLSAQLKQAIDLCKQHLSLKSVVRGFELGNDLSLLGTEFKLQGKDIARHLKGAHTVFLIAATCGFALDRLVASLLITNKTLALLTDSAGSCAVEEYLDYICLKLPKGSTTRFSCGYGDFPLAANKDIASLLDTDRKIGVKVTREFLLSPKKSVTAVVGVTNSTQNSAPLCDFKCATCKHATCLYKGN